MAKTEPEFVVVSRRANQAAIDVWYTFCDDGTGHPGLEGPTTRDEEWDEVGANLRGSIRCLNDALAVWKNMNEPKAECCKRWLGRTASADVAQVSTAVGGLIYTEMFQCKVKYCPECGGKL